MDDSKIYFRSESSIRRSLWLFVVLQVITTSAAWAVYITSGSKQYLRPLFIKQDRFHDLTGYKDKVAHLLGQSHRLGSGLPVFNYPAPAAFVYKALLFALPLHPVAPLIASVVVFALGLGVLLWVVSLKAPGIQKLKTPLVFAICAALFLGYPLAYTIDRANIEGIVWIFSSAGICLLLAERFEWAAIFIGIAASIKPFPGLFLLVLLARKKFREAITGAFITGGIMLMALVALGPNPLKASADLKEGVGYYVQHYVSDLPPPEELRFSHSVSDRLKFLVVMVKMKGIHPTGAPGAVEFLRSGGEGWPTAKRIAKVYPVILLGGLATIVLLFRRRPVLNQVTAIAIAVNILPPVASDYTILHLYVPFGALLLFLTHEAAHGRVRIPLGVPAMLMALYALLFSPLTFLKLNAGDAKLLCMVALLITMACVPMPCALFGERTAEYPLRSLREGRPVAAL